MESGLTGLVEQRTGSGTWEYLGLEDEGVDGRLTMTSLESEDRGCESFGVEEGLRRRAIAFDQPPLFYIHVANANASVTSF